MEMKNKFLLTALSLLMLMLPFSLSSCSDPEYEDELIGSYYCEATGVYIQLRGNGHGVWDDGYERAYFTWWASRRNITVDFGFGDVQVWPYDFTHDGIWIGGDYFIYADYDFAETRRKAAKPSAKPAYAPKKGNAAATE